MLTIYGVILMGLTLAFLYPSHAFILTCPSARQWLLRATKCLSASKYTCLIDFNKEIYKESCSGPLAALPGEKRVTSNKNLDIKPCTPERFQPISFSTTESSDCLFIKGKCREDGLVKYGNGTSKRDRNCRCDYTRGFAFVSSNRTDPCSCNTATEDCSCYKKACSDNQVLSSDYNCINKTDEQGTYHCPTISNRESINPVTNVVSDNDTVIGLTYENVHSTTYLRVFVVVTIVFIAFCCCWIETERKRGHYWTLLKNSCTKYKVVRHLEPNLKCFEGQSATFTCELNLESVSGKWFKYDQELIPTKYLSITVEGTLHELKIHHVKLGDRGNYFLYIRNKLVSSSSLTVLEPVETQEKNNYDRLHHLLETEAESVVRGIFDESFPPKLLKKILDENKKRFGEPLHQYWNILFPKEVDYSVRFMLQDYDFNSLEKKEEKKLKKEIKTAVPLLYSRVEGNQFVKHLNFLPGSLKVLLTLTTKHFDNKDILLSTIKSAVYDGKIGSLQTERRDFEFKMLGRENVPVSSKDFDIRLMITLMEYLDNLSISETPPSDNDNSEAACLSRIKYHNLKIEQNSEKRVSEKEFENDWTELSQAVIQLGGETYVKICNDVKNFHSSEQLQVTIIKPIDDQHCIEGDTVQFTCKVNQDIPGKWRKNGVEFESSESICITADGGNHKLVIQRVTSSDKGYYSFKVMDKSCGGHLLIEDTNYIRLCHFLKTVAEPVVRKIFDREIHPDKLEQTLNQQKQKIDRLRKHRHINRREYWLLYPREDHRKLQSISEESELTDVPVTITSKDFDIRLMIFLMKNLIDFDITPVNPHNTDITEVADLSRIKYIRNKLVQNSDRSMTDEDFKEDWNHLSQAAIRLGGNTLIHKLENLKMFRPSPQLCRDYLHPENLLSDQGSTSTESLNQEFLYETSMQNVARDVVRRRFDKQFPPQTLEKEIEKLREPLTHLKEQRDITESQWTDLYPVNKDSLSSTRFDIKVMIILLSQTSFKDKEIFRTIEKLQNYLARPKEEHEAIKEAVNAIIEES